MEYIMSEIQHAMCIGVSNQNHVIHDPEIVALTEMGYRIIDVAVGEIESIYRMAKYKEEPATKENLALVKSLTTLAAFPIIGSGGR